MPLSHAAKPFATPTLIILPALALLLVPASAQATRILSSSDAALSGALIADFDAEATGDFGSRVFAIGTESFTVTGVGGDLRIGGNWCGNFGTSGNCLETNSAGGTNDHFDVIFDGVGVSAFGFEVNALDTEWTVETFDVNDVLLGSYTIDSQSPGLTGNDRRGFFGAVETAPVKYFTVRSPGADDYVLVDDLRVVATPEPGTAMLMGLGLVGLALVRPTSVRLDD